MENFLISAFVFATICMLYATFINLRLYLKQNQTPFLLFFLCWLFQGMFWILNLLNQILLLPILFSFAIPFQVISFIFLLGFLEYSSIERIHPIRFGIFMVFATIFLFSFYFLNEVEIIPDYGVHFHGFTRIIQIVCFTYYAIMYLLWGIKTLVEAPPTLHRSSILLLVGIIFFTLFTLILYLLGSYNLIFNPIAFIVHGLGVLIVCTVIKNNQKILYILPYKAHSLTIIDSFSGIYLFHHTWDKNQPQNMKNLFSSVIQGVIKLLTTVINRGFVKEIHLDQGVILFYQKVEYPLIFVLIADQPSPVLMRALEAFAEDFIQAKSQNLTEIHNTQQFADAAELIKTNFSFLPEY